MTQSHDDVHGGHIVTPMWSTSAGSERQGAEGKEKTLAGDVKTSPPRSEPKNQLPSRTKNVLPRSKPAPAGQSRKGSHASYRRVLLPGIFASCGIYIGGEAEAARSLSMYSHPSARH